MREAHKPVTVLVEVGFPFRADDLRDGLLDESVHHGGNAQRPFLAIGLWDFHTLDRLRAITACDQLCANFRPMFLEVAGKLIDAHAVDAGRAFILADLLECALQVGPLQHPCQQRFRLN